MNDLRRLLLLIFLGSGVLITYGQEDWTSVQDRDLSTLRQSLQEVPDLTIRRSLFRFPLGGNWKDEHLKAPKYPAAGPVPPAWRYQDLAFFCKLEVKMEKALNLPVKFRLGEVQAVEQKEGKLKTHFVRQ